LPQSHQSGLGLLCWLLQLLYRLNLPSQGLLLLHFLVTGIRLLAAADDALVTAVLLSLLLLLHCLLLLQLQAACS
jgi:hypothetical protein